MFQMPEQAFLLPEVLTLLLLPLLCHEEHAQMHDLPQGVLGEVRMLKTEEPGSEVFHCQKKQTSYQRKTQLELVLGLLLKRF